MDVIGTMVRRMQMHCIYRIKRYKVSTCSSIRVDKEARICIKKYCLPNSLIVRTVKQVINLCNKIELSNEKMY